MKHRSLGQLLVAACALGLLLVVSPALAQELQWQPTIGFGGVYTEGAWTPVFVDIANSGPSVSGEIRLPVYAGMRMMRGDEREINYVVPVELPQHSKKRYMLYVPPERLEKIYLVAGGREHEQAVPTGQAMSPQDTLTVVLGGDSGLLNYLAGAQAVPSSAGVEGFDFDTGQVEPAFVQIGHATWEALPDSWVGWEGVDAVVLGDANFASASQESVEALLEWVELGGTLIVPGGAVSPLMAASPIGHLLPMDVQQTTTVPNLDALADWTDHALAPLPALIAAGSLVPEAELLCGSAEQPLIAVRPFGAGRVAMTAFDYSASPVKYWDGQTEMWRRLLSRAPAPPSVTEGVETGPGSPYRPYGDLLTLSDAATYAPAATLPPFWLLLGFLGAYVIVLVPVNYAVLNRLDRRELAWLTTPAVVLVFTLGAYGVGYGMRGHQVIFGRLGIIEAIPGSERAKGHGYLGLFSPSRTRYNLSLATKSGVIRDLTPGGAQTAGAARIVYGATPRVDDLFMNMWTSRAFAADFAVDLQGDVDGFIEWTGSELEATLINTTTYRLRDCRVVWKSSLGKTKTVKSGETGSWSSGGGKGVGDREVWQARQQLARLDVEEGISQIGLRALFGPISSGPPAATGHRPPLLLASVEEQLVPATLDVPGAQVHDVNFLLARLPVRLAAGQRVPVPAWLIAERIVAADSARRGGSAYDPGLTISSGGFAVVEFRVPVPESGGEALVLTLNVAGGAGSGGGQIALGGRVGRRGGAVISPLGAGPGAGTQPLSLSAFDFDRDLWRPLPSTFPTIALPNPGAAMSRDGRVSVKLEAHAEVMLENIELTADVRTF
jgi:hypothetical protein